MPYSRAARCVIRSLQTVGLAAALLGAPPGASAAAGSQNGNGAFPGDGFPSGPHFDLVLVGEAEPFTCPVAEPPDGAVGKVAASLAPGNVVFLPHEPGAEPVTLVMEFAPTGELEVVDGCTESFPDEAGAGFADPAVLRLPRHEQGYAVYGRVKGGLGERSFEAVPELDLVQDEAGEELLLLGRISGEKGRATGRVTNLTRLFEWTGHVCYLEETALPLCQDDTGNDRCAVRDLCCVDGGEDGSYESCAHPADVGLDSDEDGNLECPSADRDGNPYLPVEAVCREYDNTWIFDVADFAEALWGAAGRGRTLEIRFYPLPLRP